MVILPFSSFSGPSLSTEIGNRPANRHSGEFSRKFSPPGFLRWAPYPSSGPLCALARPGRRGRGSWSGGGLGARGLRGLARRREAALRQRVLSEGRDEGGPWSVLHAPSLRLPTKPPGAWSTVGLGPARSWLQSLPPDSWGVPSTASASAGSVAWASTGSLRPWDA